ncbi:MAG: aspartate kinase [Hormoscilla sp. GUM202]|nr:aspartate kinase [Hormoscilla sp. GUM202]
MAIIVQKYGGTSVGTVERIQAVAQRVQKTVLAGNSLVVVVSAMGKTTDDLVKLAKEISTNPSRREMDMLLSTGEQVSIALLSMALQELGQPAISLTGAQVGIVTEAKHSRARILEISTERIAGHLDEGKVVVVAGFQGVTSSALPGGRQVTREITTLGRGGSDTSAVALAAALEACCCEIYTDVPGILTADPRLIPDAQVMAEITCDEMLELASLGAKVLHPRAVEIARNYGITLVVKSSWTDEAGTKVISPSPCARSLEGLELVYPVDAVEFDADQGKVSMLRVPDRPGVAAELFGEIGRQDIDVDLIIQSIHEGNTNDIAFTVASNAASRASSVATAILPALGSSQARSQAVPRERGEVMADNNIAKVSIVGAGMIGRPGVAAQMFATLADAGINIGMISASEIKVSCTIAAQEGDRAVEILCQAFDVSSHQATFPGRAVGTSALPGRAVGTSPETPVRGVALDKNQARLAILSVPDRPGIAAQIFGLLAQHQISVDIIIQSQRCRVINGVPTRDIAFTVAQSQVEIARLALEELRAVRGRPEKSVRGRPEKSEWGYSEIVVRRAIAKVSAVGIGMVKHPGVAAQMFAALAAQQINIEMIATSEIKISCVVAEAEGVKALQAIHAVFGLAGGQTIMVPP